MTVTVTLETEVNGKWVTAKTGSSLDTLESLSCGAGAWFEAVLDGMKSEVKMKLEELEKESKHVT